MSEPCCVDRNTGLPRHNRLDLKQQAEEYTAVECGTVNLVTGKPDYCCFDCPTLKADLAKRTEP